MFRAVPLHHERQAARMSDFTAFFYILRLVEIGKTDDICSNPREEQTQAYIMGRLG